MIIKISFPYRICKYTLLNILSYSECFAVCYICADTSLNIILILNEKIQKSKNPTDKLQADKKNSNLFKQCILSNIMYMFDIFDSMP